MWNIFGTVIGLLIPVTLRQGFVISGVQPFWREVVVGIFLIGAVYIDGVRRASPPIAGKKPKPMAVEILTIGSTRKGNSGRATVKRTVAARSVLVFSEASAWVARGDGSREDITFIKASRVTASTSP